MANTRNADGDQTASTTGSRSKLLTLGTAGPVQMGFWVPNRVWATARFLAPLRDSIAAKRKAGTLGPMRDEVREFKEWVSGNSVYRMWVTAMIGQANAYVQLLDEGTKQEIEGDGDRVWIEDFDTFFDVLSEIISHSPSFNQTVMVGTPMNGLLALAMATDAGITLFHDSTFNGQFKKVLDAWNRFLKSPDSLDMLDVTNPDQPGSWISVDAHGAGVWRDMVHDKDRPAYGYDSWNSFFLRRFVDGARPFLGSSEVIDVGCETTPWTCEKDLELERYFWIKDDHYSLVDIFGGRREWARRFVGGQLYQGFLSATHYHRWHAPLDGKLVRSWLQPGTYFAQRPGQGEVAGTWEGTESQPYLAHVATRAIFIFEHPYCGYVALICIGMVEVSTCYIEPKYRVDEGADPVVVTRGDEIGHFEFGGSTHIMVFEKDRVELKDWALNAARHRLDENPVPMGSIIATPLPRDEA